MKLPLILCPMVGRQENGAAVLYLKILFYFVVFFFSFICHAPSSATVHKDVRQLFCTRTSVHTHTHSISYQSIQNKIKNTTKHEKKWTLTKYTTSCWMRAEQGAEGPLCFLQVSQGSLATHHLLM